MNKIQYKLIILIIFCCSAIVSCKKKNNTIAEYCPLNEIEYAQHFEIYKKSGYYELILKGQGSFLLSDDKRNIPKKMAHLPFIKIPIEKIVVTSTTHIGAIDILDVESSLIGFPNLEYISSKEFAPYIKDKKLVDLKSTSTLDYEKTLLLNPQAIIGVKSHSPTKDLQKFKETKITVLENAEWMENSPLGKAEWLKFFGLLFNKYDESKEKFNKIKTNYSQIQKKIIPTQSLKILSGAMYKNVWYVATTDSWLGRFYTDLQLDYNFQSQEQLPTKVLDFEELLIHSKKADYWFTSHDVKTYEELTKINRFYTDFTSVKNKKVYSYTSKKGMGIGSIFYESVLYYPDILLEDFASILYPHLIKKDSLTFLEKLK